jgi:hypothetical protein
MTAVGRSLGGGQLGHRLTSRVRKTVAITAALTGGAGVVAACVSTTHPAHPGTTTTAAGANAAAPVPVAQLVALARRSLPGLGDVNVTSASVVATTKRAAENWIEPGSVPPGAFSPRAYLIVLHGRFVCQSCSRPAGASEPHGSSAQFIWVPGTGVSDFGLTPRVPTGLNHLGRVVKLSLARPLLVHAIPPPGLRHAVRPSLPTPATSSRVLPDAPAHVVPTAPLHVVVPSAPSHVVPTTPPSMERGIPVH